MTYETRAGPYQERYPVYSAELWRFDTHNRGWESVVANGAAPSARYQHVMTSVGMDLWLHGGVSSYPGEVDTWSSPAALLLLLRCGRDCVCCGVQLLTCVFTDHDFRIQNFLAICGGSTRPHVDGI
jgi:hypothetical protein